MPANGNETQVVKSENHYQQQEVQIDSSLDGLVETQRSTMKNGEINTLLILNNTTIPINDPVELAGKYQGIKNVPIKLTKPPILYRNGDERNFWVLDVDENIYRNIEAKLAYQTPHVYFWIEEGQNFNMADLKSLVNYFEDQIYSREREIFGSEWSPGIDNDPHLAILYAHNLGGAAGYFSSSDSLMREVEKYSNVSEMFYLSADYINLHDDFARGVLAHEFQHMIHWNIDRNEASWINEGLSELAVELNGLTTGGFSSLFAYNPDIQLNFWPGNDQGDSTPHYGASFLFMKYLVERFGESFISDLITQSKNGLQGLDETLNLTMGAVEEKPIKAEQIFQDWTIANILQTDLVGDGIYTYINKNQVPSYFQTTTIECEVGQEPASYTVNQFGTDYYEISCDSDYKISLNWNKTNKVISENPYSGNIYYWSNFGDESAMRLSRVFDLTGVSDQAELTYKTWFDIESDYDYLYVNVSRDGLNWEHLEPPGCIKEDPTGSNLGCGYTGKSNGWIEESVDLNDYLGASIIIEFEYITDAAVNGEGFLLDDVRLNAVGFFDDFEEDDRGWFSRGFVRMDNSIPQAIGATIITSDSNVNIKKFISDGESEFSYIFNKNNFLDADILVISGLSRYTNIPAQYEMTISRLES